MISPTANDLAAAMRWHRRDVEMSQRSLAALMADDHGWTQTLVTKIERGTRTITAVEWFGVCRVLAMPVHQTWEGPPA